MCKIKNVLLWIILTVVAVSVGGCGYSGLVSNIKKGHSLEKIESLEEGLIIGRIQIFRDDKPMEMGGAVRPWVTELKFGSSDENMYRHFMQGDGYFYLSLKRGSYQMVQMGNGEYFVNSTKFTIVPLRTIFEVEPGKIIYIGTLRVDLMAGGNLRRKIDDESGMAVREFRRLFPNISQDIELNLMRFMRLMESESNEPWLERWM
ncbi:MAG: hypothetical protein Q7J31_02940 [Syntrophales bacterium]|nr:hypothetical protein [Syntrophales bacterium]